MNGQGGCGLVLVVLLVVAATFGAGYLFAVDSLAPTGNEVVAGASAEDENTRLRLAVTQANEARLIAEKALAETTTSLEQAKAALAVETARRVEAEAIAAAAVAEAARSAQMAAQTPIIPRSGSASLVSIFDMLMMAGIGIVGMLAGAILTLAVSSPERSWAAGEAGTVMVKMTRSEARAYSHIRGKG